jgi:hypothetical protein
VARGSSKSSGSTDDQRTDTDGDTPQADKAMSEVPDTVETATDSVTTTADAPETGTTGWPRKEAADTPAVEDADFSDVGRDEAPGPEDQVADLPNDTPIDADSLAGAAGDDRLADDAPDRDDSEIGTVATDGDETVTVHAGDEDSPAAEDTRPAEASPAPTPVPPPAPERRGGFVPLVLGGVIAAGIGYGAAYMGYLPTAGGDSDQSAAIADALQGQSETLAALQAQVSDLAAAVPAAAQTGEVDFSPVLEQIEGLATRLGETTGSLETLAARVATLEDRPILSGDIDTDTAAALEAASRLEAELMAEREAAAARAEALQAAETAAAEAEAEAAAAIAEAEAAAAAATARAQADAALGQVQVALETGAPFADALAALDGVVAVPEGLSATADTGVQTLEALQNAFPPLARTALPIALQETAGEAIGDRLGAFVMGQVGGRSVEPREGDDPDAVLSRIEAAVRSGDLNAALGELPALPAGAQAELADWAAAVEARAAAEAGLAALTATLAGTGN